MGSLTGVATPGSAAPGDDPRRRPTLERELGSGLRVPAGARFPARDSRVLGRALGDAPLTADEVDGLAADLLVTRDPATGATRFSAWLEENADALGRAWANELARHFR